jgi:hypothetical protein
MHGTWLTFMVNVGAAVAATLVLYLVRALVSMAKSVRTTSAASVQLANRVSELGAELGAHAAQIAALQRALGLVPPLPSDPYHRQQRGFRGD